MTIGEFIQAKLQEYQLEELVCDHNNDYTYVRFNKIDNSLKAMNFANFVAEAQLVEIRGNDNGSISCWF